MFEEHITFSAQNYVDPHPKEAKVVPASEAVTEGGRARGQAVEGIKVKEANGTA